MSPLPAQFIDRWGSNRGGLSYEDSVCWHLLLGRHARVRTVVADAQRRLAPFGGMHMTPARWLHATVLLAGPAASDPARPGRHYYYSNSMLPGRRLAMPSWRPALLGTLAPFHLRLRD